MYDWCKKRRFCELLMVSAIHHKRWICIRISPTEIDYQELRHGWISFLDAHNSIVWEGRTALDLLSAGSMKNSEKRCVINQFGILDHRFNYIK